jgi:hypothetical protein
VDRRDHVALRRRVVAGHEPDEARDARQGRLRSAAKRPSRGELLLQALERGEVRAEPERSIEQRPQPESPRCSKSSGRPEDVYALAVREVEPERVRSGGVPWSRRRMSRHPDPSG